jgi:hypothetical protein
MANGADGDYGREIDGVTSAWSPREAQSKSSVFAGARNGSPTDSIARSASARVSTSVAPLMEGCIASPPSSAMQSRIAFMIWSRTDKRYSLKGAAVYAGPTWPQWGLVGGVCRGLRLTTTFSRNELLGRTVTPRSRPSLPNCLRSSSLAPRPPRGLVPPRDGELNGYDCAVAEVDSNHPVARENSCWRLARERNRASRTSTALFSLHASRGVPPLFEVGARSIRGGRDAPRSQPRLRSR